jgi:hypothetical protein
LKVQSTRILWCETDRFNDKIIATTGQEAFIFKNGYHDPCLEKGSVH